MAHISVVIPVYKGEPFLQELYDRLRSALEGITPDYEIVLVDDCGGDRSWEVIQTLAKADPRVKGIRFSRNFGQHYGITAGIDHCDGDWVVVMDCDLQDRPEEIPRLYAKAQEGFDVVLARRGRRKDGFLKRSTSRMFYDVLNFASGLEYDSQVGCFRIISRKVADAYRSMRENLRFFGALVQWMGFRVASIDVQHAERPVGRSGYTVRKLLKLAMDTVIAYSDKPLRWSVGFGFVMAALGFGYGALNVARYFFFGSEFTGWTSVIASIYLVGGVIIVNLGVIGIYLGKVYDETKRRPLYIVSQTTWQ